MYIPSQHKVSVHITDALIVVSAAKFPLSESHCSAFVLVGVLSGGFCGAARRRKNSFKNIIFPQIGQEIQKHVWLKVIDTSNFSVFG